MSSLTILVAIVITACSGCGILIAAVLAISWGIHREDRKGTLTGPPPAMDGADTDDTAVEASGAAGMRPDQDSAGDAGSEGYQPEGSGMPSL